MGGEGRREGGRYAADCVPEETAECDSCSVGSVCDVSREY